jgi:hypothetical protein
VAHGTCSLSRDGSCLSRRPTSTNVRPLDSFFTYATPAQLSLNVPSETFLPFLVSLSSLFTPPNKRQAYVQLLSLRHTRTLHAPRSLSQTQKQLVLDAHSTTPPYTLAVSYLHPLHSSRYPAPLALTHSLYVGPTPEIAFVSTLTPGLPATER